ncbi:MAG TPA: FliM/FliN family flagellar motor switch protein [Parvularculaceae bacterium]|nr:FliM/FliN family flagellar motor switch protein [Parvularculaceae bacterium]
MSEQKLSVLARKISANAAKAEAFPDLAPFAAAIAKAAAGAASELLAGDFAKAETARLCLLGEHLDGAADPGFYHWFTDAEGAPTALIAVSPAFASAVTARLLGGDLSIGANNSRPSAVDFGMAASLVDLAGPAFGEIFARRSPRLPKRLFAEKRAARALKDVLKERDSLLVYAISIDLKLDEASAPAALSVAFPAPLLDKAGLMRRAHAAAPSPTATSSWTDQMRRNVLAAEIPLAVVLDRFTTNIGELSRLEIGKVIDLRANALQRLDIAATTTAGAETVANARLGAYQGRKAVKLTGPIDPHFIKGLGSA